MVRDTVDQSTVCKSGLALGGREGQGMKLGNQEQVKLTAVGRQHSPCMGVRGVNLKLGAPHLGLFPQEHLRS